MKTAPYQEFLSKPDSPMPKALPVVKGILLGMREGWSAPISNIPPYLATYLAWKHLTATRRPGPRWVETEKRLFTGWTEELKQGKHKRFYAQLRRAVNKIARELPVGGFGVRNLNDFLQGDWTPREALELALIMERSIRKPGRRLDKIETKLAALTLKHVWDKEPPYNGGWATPESPSPEEPSPLDK